MMTNVAECRSAKQGISERMQRDVRIRMPDKTACVRDGNPAQPDRPRISKSMNVKPRPGAADHVSA